MSKIVFFTEGQWAYGNIHNALCRLMYKEGVLCELLNWSIPRQLEEMQAILATIDYFVTTPLEVGTLFSYQIPIQKIKIVAHGEIDLFNACSKIGHHIFENCAGFAVVGESLKTKAAELEIKRVPELLHIGVDVDRYICKPAEILTSVGYGGIMRAPDFFGNDIKRGYLVEQCCKTLGLKFKSGKIYHYLSMPYFYKEVDCVIMSSTQESVGLPMLEAGIAGRLTIGTPVGYNKTNEAAIQVPIDASEFQQEVTKTLTHYIHNPDQFKQKCLETQRYAVNKYSWENYRKEWASFLSK